MFEDSLVESTHRLHTHSPRYAVGSFLLQTALLSLLLLIPLLSPAALPRQYLNVRLIAPPPPSAPPPQQPAAPASRPVALNLALTAPRIIPNRIDLKPEPPAVIPGAIGPAPGVPGGLFTGSPASPAPQVRLAPPSAPVRISSGVAQGMILTPIRPVYPRIAIAAGIQGTVVVEATISARGTIQNLRVLRGPVMLIGAALDAIRPARYRPYLLNGRPVPVQTTISVVFSLHGS